MRSVSDLDQTAAINNSTEMQHHLNDITRKGITKVHQRHTTSQELPIMQTPVDKNGDRRQIGDQLSNDIYVRS